ncbi:MAG: hypothetical protein ACPGEC_04355 [Flavobacteriales bacterium]
MHKLHKYLNSFDQFALRYKKPIGIFVAVLAILLLAYKLISESQNERLSLNFDWNFTAIAIGFLVITFLLNHLLDALVWKSILSSNQIYISLLKSLSINWKSIFYSVSTPANLGEIVARRLYLDQENKTKVYKASGLHYVLKSVAYALLCLLLLTYYFLGLLAFVLMIISIVLLSFYFKKSKILLFTSLNVIKTLIYSFQHLILIYVCFSIQVFEFQNLMNISFIHSFTALIPSWFASNLVLKTLMFPMLSFSISFAQFGFSVFLLWLINICVPAFCSLFIPLKSND